MVSKLECQNIGVLMSGRWFFQHDRMNGTCSRRAELGEVPFCKKRDCLHNVLTTVMGK